jgi:hypothetical protein
MDSKQESRRELREVDEHSRRCGQGCGSENSATAPGKYDGHRTATGTSLDGHLQAILNQHPIAIKWPSTNYGFGLAVEVVV